MSTTTTPDRFQRKALSYAAYRIVRAVDTPSSAIRIRREFLRDRPQAWAALLDQYVTTMRPLYDAQAHCIAELEALTDTAVARANGWEPTP